MSKYVKDEGLVEEVEAVEEVAVEEVAEEPAPAPAPAKGNFTADGKKILKKI